MLKSFFERKRDRAFDILSNNFVQYLQIKISFHRIFDQEVRLYSIWRKTQCILNYYWKLFWICDKNITQTKVSS